MNSKIKLIKVERILVQVVPKVYEVMMIGEPPNDRIVQRDDLRIAQLRGDWSRRSSTIIPSPVHIKLIKHPISMVPMWKFPTSTMVLFRVCFFERGKGLQKEKHIPFQEDLDAKNPPRYLGPFLGGLILGGCHYIIINLTESSVVSAHVLGSLLLPLFSMNLPIQKKNMAALVTSTLHLPQANPKNKIPYTKLNSITENRKNQKKQKNKKTKKTKDSRERLGGS